MAKALDMDPERSDMDTAAGYLHDIDEGEEDGMAFGLGPGEADVKEANRMPRCVMSFRFDLQAFGFSIQSVVGSFLKCLRLSIVGMQLVQDHLIHF